MLSKSSRSFSLLEVIVAVSILSIAIVFILRAFTTVLSSLKFSQNVGLACFLAEDKLWEIEQRWKDANVTQLDSYGNETMQGRVFSWSYTTEDVSNLTKLEFTVTWQEKVNEEKTYKISTYLPPK